MFDLTGKTALVTGASRGIGRALVKALVQRQWKVLACARRLDDTGEDGKDVRRIALDVTDERSVAELAKALDDQGTAVHALFNNAGVLHDRSAKVSDVDAALMSSTFDTNVNGVQRVTAACLPSLARSGANFKVVNVSSAMGSIANVCRSDVGPSTNLAVSYRVSKAALNMLTACWAAELRLTHPGAAFVAVHPGWVDTDMGSQNGRVTPPVHPAAAALAILDAHDHALPGSCAFVDTTRDNAALPW